MFSLREKIGREEFDYLALMSALADYANPRAKVTSLLRTGVIIRVKKGLYVFGEKFRRRPFCRELLANLIYGPSYISLDYALAWHNLIPERVAVLTSITCKRAREFSTPVGVFVYRSRPRASFFLGMERVERDGLSFLMATPERALADKLRDDRGGSLRSLKEMSAYLFDNQRIDPAAFRNLDTTLFAQLAAAMSSRKVSVANRLLHHLRERPV